jgi:GTP-binding protein HflX
MNKIDLTALSPRIERDEYGRILRVWASAETGAGVDSIRLVLEEGAGPSLTPAELDNTAAA